MIGSCPAFGYMTTLVNNLGKYKPRMEFFPGELDYTLHDPDIPGIEEMIFDEQKTKLKKESEVIFDHKKNERVDSKKEKVINKEDKVMTKEKVKVKKATKYDDENVQCETCELLMFKSVAAVHSDLQKLMQLQGVGLDANFKCPSCRECEECSKRSGYERISRKQEAEQELIR